MRVVRRQRCSRCLQVSFTATERYQAIRELVRPWDVADLWVPGWPDRVWPKKSTAQAVAEWFRLMFFIGRLRYIPDGEGPDIWCPPCTTLERGGGDCDDLSILAASTVEVKNDGLTFVAVGNLCTDLGCLGHAWVEGTDEDGWFLLEATTGQLYRSKRPRAYQIQLLLNRAGFRLVA